MLKAFPQFYYTVQGIVALHICRNHDFDLELWFSATYLKSSSKSSYIWEKDENIVWFIFHINKTYLGDLNVEFLWNCKVPLTKNIFYKFLKSKAYQKDLEIDLFIVGDINISFAWFWIKFIHLKGTKCHSWLSNIHISFLRIIELRFLRNLEAWL